LLFGVSLSVGGVDLRGFEGFGCRNESDAATFPDIQYNIRKETWKIGTDESKMQMASSLLVK